jgi:AcrR family transcriptional regulator
MMGQQEWERDERGGDHMRADARAKRRAILDAAWRLVAERGVDVPMRVIAQEAGVGDATLYRHFPTPDDLIVGLLGEVLERVGRVVDACEASWDQDPARAWRTMIRDLARLEYGALGYQIAPLAHESESMRTQLLPLQQTLAERVSAVIARAEAAHLAEEGLQPERFFLGVAAISRPLPPQVEDLFPGQRDWLAEVYARGLGPRD